MSYVTHRAVFFMYFFKYQLVNHTHHKVNHTYLGELNNNLNKCVVHLIQQYLPQDLKGALSGLRRFFTTKSTLKMMKNAFYFTLKALSLLKISEFLS